MLKVFEHSADPRLWVLVFTLVITAGEGRAASFVNFSVPGSYQTIVADINRSATVTGYFLDPVGVDSHGFVRSFAGTIVVFDAPGATKKIQPIAINANGAVTGDFLDSGGESHGFLRTAAGALIAFDAPGAVNGPFGGTYPMSLNPSDTIVGGYLGADGFGHGFMRNSDGTFAILDVPGGTNTNPTAINDAGTVTGEYSDGTFIHGFVWSARQSFTTFDIPGAVDTFPVAINVAGTVAGQYSQKGHNLPYLGFARGSDGTITTFEVPGGGVTVKGISESGEITGTAETLDTFEFFGFVRSSSGSIGRFLVPGSYNTTVGSLNNNGVVAGSAAINGSLSSGFLRIP